MKPRNTRGRMTLSPIGSSLTEAIVNTEDELRSNIGAIAASGSGYGKAIVVRGTIPITSQITLNGDCAGITLRGSGLLVLGEFTGTGIVITGRDVTIDGVTMKRGASSVLEQTLINSQGDFTVVRNVRILAGTDVATSPDFSFTRRCLVIGCVFAATSSAAGVLVTGVAANASIIGNHMTGQGIDTSGGTDSTVVGNTRCGTVSLDATDASSANT